MNKQAIKELALESGFKLKEQPDGSMDLNPYVYVFALALMEKSGRAGYVKGYNEALGVQHSGLALILADEYALLVKAGEV